MFAYTGGFVPQTPRLFPFGEECPSNKILDMWNKLSKCRRGFMTTIYQLSTRLIIYNSAMRNLRRPPAHLITCNAHLEELAHIGLCCHQNFSLKTNCLQPAVWNIVDQSDWRRFLLKSCWIRFYSFYHRRASSISFLENFLQSSLLDLESFSYPFHF